jgi:hypothetical protein
MPKEKFASDDDMHFELRWGNETGIILVAVDDLENLELVYELNDRDITRLIRSLRRSRKYL